MRGLLLLVVVFLQAGATDPKIDILDLDILHPYLGRYCNRLKCPQYAVSEEKVPKPLQLRQYDETYWLATPSYPATNGSCLLGDSLNDYYNQLVNYFNGLNKMGLRLERTKPVRIVARFHPENSDLLECCIRFYIPDMVPLQPPAPIVTSVYVGFDMARECYVLGKRGGTFSWKSILGIHKNMLKYVSNLKNRKRGLLTTEIVVDVFTGYGVPSKKQYIEILVCYQLNL